MKYNPKEKREPRPRVRPEDYRAWTDLERERLFKLVEAGNEPQYIALKLKRPVGDVAAEMSRLDMKSGMYEPDPLTVPPTPRTCLSCGAGFESRSYRTCPNCRKRVDYLEGADILGIDRSNPRHGGVAR